MASIEGVEILQYCGQKEKLKKITLEFSDGNIDTVFLYLHVIKELLILYATKENTSV